MSLTIGAGFAAGVAASDWILNYQKKQYEDRISELETCLSKLNAHYETLQSYRNEICNFWESYEALHYGKLLDIEIRAVYNAQEQVKHDIEANKEIIAGMKDTTTLIVEKVADIASTLGALDIK